MRFIEDYAMSTPAFRFSLTGAEIERLLLSIQERLSNDDIVYDYTLGGAQGKVAAAEAVKEMWLKLNTMVTGQGLVDAINDAPDSNVFTDYYKGILDRENWKFIGSPADIIARDDIVTTGFTGGEVILLQKNDAGNPEFQYWKRTPVAGGDASYSWESVYAGTSNDVTIEVPTAGGIVLKTVPKSIFHMIEFRIHAYDKVLGHWQDVNGKVGHRGDDLIYSIYNEIQTKRLIEYSFSQDADNVYVSITSLQDSLRCSLAFVSGH